VGVRAKLGGAWMAVLPVALVFARPTLPQAAIAEPYWQSDRIRAAHAGGPENALAFDLRTDVIDGAAPARTETASVTLTTTYDYTVAGTEHVLEDYSLCRILGWSNAKPLLTDVSCYAMPAFFVFEIRNRALLTKIIAGAVASAKQAATPRDTVDPYWAEAELRVQEEPKDRLTKQVAGAAIKYRLGDEVVVTFSGAAATLNTDERKEVVRYLARTQPLHPQVRRDIADELPARIEIATATAGRKQHLVLTITNVRRTRVDYPLPSDLSPDLLAGGDSVKARGVAATVAAAEGRAPAAKPSLGTLVSEMRKAAAAHRYVELEFLFLELTQQYGAQVMAPENQPALREIGTLVQPALHDPEGALFWQASSLAGDSRSSGDREAAARYLAGAKNLDALPFGTFRYVTFANLVRGSDTSKWDPATFQAMPTPLVDNYWTHIAAYPWASNAFKDAGDAYFQGYEMDEAWQAWDLGRAVDPDWRTGVMANVARLEAELRTNEPDFF
jgi:hypothetical protein